MIRGTLKITYLGEETADKGVAGSVGVDNLVGGELVHGVLLDLAVLAHNGGVGALGEHHQARAVLVHLGVRLELDGDLGHVLSLDSKGGKDGDW